MKRIPLLTLASIAWGMGATWAAEDVSCRLVPPPAQVDPGTGPGLTIANGVSIVLPDRPNANDRFAAAQLRDEVRERLGVVLPIRADAPDHARPVIRLARRLPGAAPPAGLQGLGYQTKLITSDQGYFLAVTAQQVVVYGHSQPGLFYGVQTLRQLVRLGKTIPAVRIHDWPSLEYRCIQDDISRGPVPKMELWKRIIRTAAHYKMNMVCFYIEHVFAFKKHPVIGPKGGSLTPEQVRELVAYARPYHVDILPQFQNFAHQWHILKHPEYAHVREHPNGSSVFSPAVPATYTLLDELWSELLPPFSSPFFHIGCDEVTGLERGRSKELVKKHGTAGVYVRHIQKLCQMLRKYQRTPMFWGDIALHKPEMIPELPRELIFMNWTYSPMPSFEARVKKIADAGLKQFVCPGVSCWSQTWPRMKTAVTNIGNFVRDGAKYHVMGMLNTTWDDDGENFWNPNWYGAVYSASVSWNAARRTTACFDKGFAAQFFGPRCEPLVAAMWMLDRCNETIAGSIRPNHLFRDPPLGGKGRLSMPRFGQRMDELLGHATAVRRLVAKHRSCALGNTDTPDYIDFAAWKFATLARKYRLAAQAATLYRQAYDQSTDRAKAAERIEQAAAGLDTVRAEVEALKKRYAELWLHENRPYWLDKILPRYDGLAKWLRHRADGLRALVPKARAGEKLPLPESMQMGAGVPEPAVAQVRYIERTHATKTRWHVPGCTWRAFVELRVPRGTCTQLPVDMPLDLRALAGPDLAERIDTMSFRVVLDPGDKTEPVVLTCQYEPRPDEKIRLRGHLVWIDPGPVVGKKARYVWLYFGEKGRSAKPAPVGSTLRVTQDKGTGDWWVDTGAVRVRWACQGGALVEWRVKALNDLDATDPGLTDYHGFAETMNPYRSQKWNIQCTSVGPVRVVLQGKAPDGFTKTIVFYAGRNWCDVRLSLFRRTVWNYDNAKHMAIGTKTPGRYLFSTGQTGPLPTLGGDGSTRPRHYARWACKSRPDGLCLGMVVPDENCALMVGPGAGMGGVGIEGGNMVRRFITVCGKIADPKAVLDGLYNTLRSKPALQAAVFKTQQRR